MKPEGWPRHMIARGGAYYWQPPSRDRAAGCPVAAEPLGRDYAAAIARAEVLNRQLTDWRANRGATPLPRDDGTVRWWLARYLETRAVREASPAWRAELARHIRIVTELPLTRPTRSAATVGDLAVASLTPAACDRLYERLAEGRARQGEIELAMMRRAWGAVQRLHPDRFPPGNPLEGIRILRRSRATTRPASRAEAYALAEALAAAGHTALGAAALICFEWHQRPVNVLRGAITWTDYRPGTSVRIEHQKTGAMVDLPLADEDGPLYPEIEAWLARLPRRGAPIVLAPGEPAAPYQPRRAREAVAAARAAAGLADDLTLAACRHGGLTELGDAEVTEAEGMAVSGHRTASNLRLYVKATERQRLSAARKRRAWLDRGGS
ncbi:hypothetical protein LNKW23_18310 [Paralimibaculum aggregatum]|uniref:Tyr recombinase domain-containing protein n=1 Tax=Paralimibaculum aggregatum TaxID=3036245 RepID=A0ABQ6LN45_9RHOB|nr:hypothetical protein [Limibaculum sp. NKW23]GMG82618.1 hypothetical protein LNKW23_18310 [Limibaculum sp. NKW23]